MHAAVPPRRTSWQAQQLALARNTLQRPTAMLHHDKFTLLMNIYSSYPWKDELNLSVYVPVP